MAIELMEQLDLATDFLCHGGWGLINRSCYPNQAAYRNAIYRLRKRGLIIEQQSGGRTPILTLTAAGKGLLPAYLTPHSAWDRKWNKIWYLLVYDVPEADRSYRNTLRRFLKKMHLGCLQQSVWITPTDIRPDYHDLMKGAAIDSFAFLFESHTVLGLPQRRIVENAWDFERLYQIQNHYCKVMEQNLHQLQEKHHGIEALASLLQLALESYHSAFIEDPLLPGTLLPPDYQGKRAYQLHQSIISELNNQSSRV